MLSSDFIQTLYSLTGSKSLAGEYWEEIVARHSHPDRHYHSLQHLQSVWQQLQPVRQNLEDWAMILFAIAYHDFIYHVQRSNNEEKSADKAVEKLMMIEVEKGRADRCYRHIIATKGHQVSADPDTNYFTDADLSILGSDAATYQRYTDNIRKEYRIYPSFMYRPGRKKVLQHFLSLPRIFKTDHFYDLYEVQARINLHNESASL
jgi:predicted metal-dependent HD superfamily phosphohydrolase